MRFVVIHHFLVRHYSALRFHTQAQERCGWGRGEKEGGVHGGGRRRGGRRCGVRGETIAGAPTSCRRMLGDGGEI